MAFSSILDGPSSETIGPYVNQSIPILLAALSDPHDMVKDTTAWTIGRICELHVRSIPHETFPTLVNGLLSKLLTESPQVSSQACYALHNLASAFAEDDTAQTSGTNALTPFMPGLLESLLQVTDRDDADEKNLRNAAFEAISALIQNGAPDCKRLYEKLLPAILGRLQASFSVPVLTNEDKERKEGVQGLLCGLIQVLVYKLEVQDLLPHADSIMQNLLQVLQTKNATCHEEAFSATSAVCDKLESHFDVSIWYYMIYISMQIMKLACNYIFDYSNIFFSKICQEIHVCTCTFLGNGSEELPGISCLFYRCRTGR